MTYSKSAEPASRPSNFSPPFHRMACRHIPTNYALLSLFVVEAVLVRFLVFAMWGA